MGVFGIEIRQTSGGRFFVPHHWPHAALIAADVINSPAFGGDGTALVTRDAGKSEILIEVENGSATYRIRSLLTDGNYLCDLVGSDWLEPPR